MVAQSPSSIAPAPTAVRPTDQVATVTELGALRSEFRPSGLARWFDLAFVGLLCAGAAAFSAVAIEFAPTQPAANLAVAWALAAGLLAIVPLLIWRNWHKLQRGLRRHDRSRSTARGSMPGDDRLRGAPSAGWMSGAAI